MRPREGGLQRGEHFCLRLTTASADSASMGELRGGAKFLAPPYYSQRACLHLCARFFHSTCHSEQINEMKSIMRQLVNRKLSCKRLQLRRDCDSS